MKKILVGINASYTHTNLAIRYLSKVSNIPFKEFNINMPQISILSSIIDYDILMFSCYIWNIDYILAICENIKKIDKNKIIILGGPEVSFDCKKLMEENTFIDYIMCGESEDIINNFMYSVENNLNINQKGIFYKINNKVIGEEYYNTIQNLDSLPFPYDTAPENKIAYFESSRGCPYKCQYCLSGNIGGGVRFMSLDKIKFSLEKFSKMNIKIVKFIDRTFNVNKKRTVNILNLILSLNDDICYHFEIGADLLDDEIINIFNTAKKGKFQIEAGIQSFNQQTLKTVERNSDIGKICENIKKLNHNTHIHIDLIAGLPYEDIVSFKESFNKAYELNPDMLQLGFLKMLKGSKIRTNDYDITYTSYPPYEVLRTKELNFKDIILLKKIDNVVDKFYNSQNFSNTLSYYRQYFSSPFDMFEKFTEILGDEIFNPISLKKCIETIYTSSKSILSINEQYILLNLLKYDYVSSNAKGNKPECFELIEEKYILKDIRKKYNIDKNIRFDIININPKTKEKEKHLVFYGEKKYIKIDK